MSETSDFLKDTEVKQEDFFDKPLEIPEKDDAEELEMKLKNRRERRLADKLQSEREANIALNARLQALSETQKFREEIGDDPLKKVEAIFGTDTPEKLAATNLLKEALSGMSDRARANAIEEIRGEQENESKAIAKEVKTLDSMEEVWEDEYGIDMSDDIERKRVYSLVERLSRKDPDGNIIEYPDPDGVGETYNSIKDRSSNRAKELASRSQTRSGASQTSTIEQDQTWKYLRDKLGW